MKRVVVGMSGGVDSSVAALLLKEQGFDVIGLFMKNWEENDQDGICQASKEFDDVVRVCETIDIPYYSVNFTKEYQESVFSAFLKDLQAGYTPNPDILCNREIKFKVLLDKAKQLGGSYLATGHYAREEDGKLLKGVDPNKDQSYFLYTLSSDILKNVLFPIGHLPKEEVRLIAKTKGIPTAEKKDSTGICFIGERNFKPFLSQFLGYTKGNIETVEGKVIGTHDGIAYHTIGQRKGLGIGGAGEAWFVVGKDQKRNVVIVAQGEAHPALFQDSLFARELTWVSGRSPSLDRSYASKIRYRQTDQVCSIVSVDEEGAKVSFSSPQRAVTPGQSIVFYDGPVCLGGGIITA